MTTTSEMNEIHDILESDENLMPFGAAKLLKAAGFYLPGVSRRHQLTQLTARIAQAVDEADKVTYAVDVDDFVVGVLAGRGIAKGGPKPAPELEQAL